MNERRTCPECNFVVLNYRCTNPDNCNYRGPGWSAQQRSEAWQKHPGEWERTASAYTDYSGRD